MHESAASAPLQTVSDWWSTGLIEVRPGTIHLRGIPIQQLIGSASFPQIIWLMLRGELPTPDQSRLLEAALVAAVDHGPHAPSIAIARMAVSCGQALNGAMASAINVLDDVHGGAGEQCLALYRCALQRQAALGLEAAAEAALDEQIATNGRIVPGFGHRFHPVDPRSVRLLALVDAASQAGTVTGEHAHMARAMEAALQRRTGRHLPMNIDGATAVVYGELGFAPALARGLFVLSRSVGILAHAWEQAHQGQRIKGPMPPTIPYTYTGPAGRP